MHSDIFVFFVNGMRRSLKYAMLQRFVQRRSALCIVIPCNLECLFGTRWKLFYPQVLHFNFGAMKDLTQAKRFQVRKVCFILVSWSCLSRGNCQQRIHFPCVLKSRVASLSLALIRNEMQGLPVKTVSQGLVLDEYYEFMGDGVNAQHPVFGGILFCILELPE